MSQLREACKKAGASASYRFGMRPSGSVSAKANLPGIVVESWFAGSQDTWSGLRTASQQYRVLYKHDACNRNKLAGPAAPCAIRGRLEGVQMIITRVSDICVSPDHSLREVMACIDRNRLGIAMVVDEDRRLLGTVTDGDVRRAVLAGKDLGCMVHELLEGKLGTHHARPVTAPVGTDHVLLQQLMRHNVIRHLPILDDAGRVLELVVDDGPTSNADKPCAFIMAGGEGMRLRPLTENVPKPMLKVGKQPLLEIVLRSLCEAGFVRVFLNVRYLGHVIEDYFGDGSRLNLELHYLREPDPLGTAGGLASAPIDLRPTSPFLVVNGDILTKVDFRVFREYHISADYELTLCARRYETQIPYGYPVLSGDVVTGFEEKPTLAHLVNSGVYCLNADLIEEIPVGQHFNMPDLIQKLCREKRRVGVFPVREPFHEIGRVESYEKAHDFYEEHFAARS